MAVNKDWTGNSKSIHVMLSASNHSDTEREINDYYATSPRAVEMLLEKEEFSKNIWEPACGGNHITKVLRKNGYNVKTSDIIDRIGDGSVEILDFLKIPSGLGHKKYDMDIITNPPYKYAQEFVEKSLDIIEPGRKVAMYLKIQFLETSKRYELFKKYPPKYIYVSVRRLGCAKNGEWSNPVNETDAGAACYCWYIWEKGFKGEPIIRWFNY